MSPRFLPNFTIQNKTYETAKQKTSMSTRLKNSNLSAKLHGTSSPLLSHRSARWKWMAGSAAASAAAVSAQAATVQITQGNNFVSSTQNSLNADLTGDTNNDAVLATNATGGYTFTNILGSVRRFVSSNFAGLTVNGSSAAGFARYRLDSRRYTAGSTFKSSSRTYFVTAGVGAYYAATTGTGLRSLNGLVPITFSDSRINSGANTSGFLDVRAFNQSSFIQVVQIVRLVFNDASPNLPGGVVAGGNNPDWVPPTTPTDPNAALRASLSNKIKKLKKKQKASKKKGKVAKAKKLKKKIKKLSKRLRSF